MTSSGTAAPVSNSAGPGFEVWFTPARFGALLALLIALSFLDVVTGQATFFYRDFGVFTYPVATFQRDCFWHGQLPLWDPLNNLGVPFLAQWNTSVLYPLSLFYLVFPLSWSLGVFELGHLWLAGMGMYFLARRWTGNPLAASLAGAAFAFNGLTWQMLVWVSNLAAWAWMPWVILALEPAWRLGGGRRIALAALAGAMQLLTGSPEIIFLTWCVAGTLWLMEFVAGTAPRGKMFGRMAAVGLLAAGMSAAQLVPFLELLRDSNRTASFSELGWAMPLSGPANFLTPLFRCFKAGHGVYSQFDQYWTPSYYEGAGLVALALLAVWRVRNRRVVLLGAAVVLSVLMALGPAAHVYPLAKKVLPVLGFMRYPVKFVVLALFALPLLAAYAVNWLQAMSEQVKSSQEAAPLPVGRGEGEDLNAPFRSARRDVIVTGVVVLGLIAVILWFDRLHPLDWQNQENHTLLWQNGLDRGGLLVLILGALVLLFRQRALKTRLLLGCALLLLQWADIYTHTPEINPTVARSVYEPGWMRKQLKLPPEPQTGEPRAMSTLAATEHAHFTYLTNSAEEYICRRLALYENCNLLDGIPKIDGFFSSFLREPDQIMRLLLVEDEQGADLKGLKDFLGVAYISAAGTTNAGGLDWTNRTTYLPLIIAGQKPEFAEGTNAARVILSAAFDPRHTVFLPPDAKAVITATNETAATVVPVSLSAQRLEFDTDTPAPAMVTVAQSFYRAWHAYVDGREVPLWRANYAFQALEVPAGRHRAVVVYEDRGFLWGVVLSVICLVGSGCLFISGRKEGL